MSSLNLIIFDSLVNPPTDSLAFRYVTMICHSNLEMSVLLQTTQEFKDIFYYWMLQKGMMDYMDYLLNEHEKEPGIKLYPQRIDYRTVLTDTIKFENQLELIAKIAIFR